MLSDHEELVPAWQVFQSVKAVSGLNSYDQWIRAVVGFGAGERAVRDVTDDWLVVDYLMRNTDRHYNNFGLIRNIETLAVRLAPIYDIGASLWSGELDVDDRDWFAKPFYSATGRPSSCGSSNWWRIGAGSIWMLCRTGPTRWRTSCRACACSRPNASMPSGYSW